MKLTQIIFDVTISVVKVSVEIFIGDRLLVCFLFSLVQLQNDKEQLMQDLKYGNSFLFHVLLW